MEQERLKEERAGLKRWKQWGPYLSERQWGTVREDYSPQGDAWNYFSHDQARSRAYLWGEDGIAGISDNRQLLCLAFAFWNGTDPIIKERLFGLTNSEGNHGEDVKEYYYYLDSTPTHSYMKYLYKYPHNPYPYDNLVKTNRTLGRFSPEYELIDTGVFDSSRYFDIVIEYAKHQPEDILAKVTVFNRGDTEATLHLLPTLWFRNTWALQSENEKPSLNGQHLQEDVTCITAIHPDQGASSLYAEGAPELLFTDNETNTERLFNLPNRSRYVKDGIDNRIVHGTSDAVNPDLTGTKASLGYHLTVPPASSVSIRLRLISGQPAGSVGIPKELFGEPFEESMRTRKQEADQFYEQILPGPLSDDDRNIMRQAFAGMLWSKQYYYFDTELWKRGAGVDGTPGPARTPIRNMGWTHLVCDDVISMPDKWEYPWFAAWDLAFHAVTLSLVDIDFAKQQLELITRPWYMHPNGQLPAYEWNFSDVNPPVHAWASWYLYQHERKAKGSGDRRFLERIFQKLMINFTWWVNRKDAMGNNVFEGGFLGLDNIGVFDRSMPLPCGGSLEQSDGTSWMAMFSLNMMEIALELSKEDPSYQDIAYKFYEHFVYIGSAMDRMGVNKDELWDEEDGFFYDLLLLPDNNAMRLKVRSMVGLLPMCATVLLSDDELSRLPNLKSRIEWLARNRPELAHNMLNLTQPGPTGMHILSVLNEKKLRRILERMLDEEEFLSPYGIRSLSRHHQENPYVFTLQQNPYRVDYEPSESTTGLFGGNSNWRGPVWLPVNFLICNALLIYDQYFGPDFKVECPTRSGNFKTLREVAHEIIGRLLSIFRQQEGRRPVFGGTEKFQNDPYWRDLILFYEYFHGDNGAGIGASHQTGWTGLIAVLCRIMADLDAGNLPEGH
ncbi:MAG: glucosidase [Desulfuromonadales bacterium]